MKNFLLTLGLFLMVSAVAFSQLQVQSGTWGANTQTKYYTLNENSGERSVMVEVTFKMPFEVKPDVVLGVSLIDVENNTAVKYSVTPMSISRDGFTVQVKTWSDTRIFSISGFWVANTPPSEM